MSRENKPLNRLIEVLEIAGDKDTPPVRAIVAVAAAITVIIENDSKNVEGNRK